MAPRQPFTTPTGAPALIGHQGPDEPHESEKPLSSFHTSPAVGASAAAGQLIYRIVSGPRAVHAIEVTDGRRSSRPFCHARQFGLANAVSCDGREALRLVTCAICRESIKRREGGV